MTDVKAPEKKPPVEAHQPGADNHADSTSHLHGQVHDIHAGGNVQPSADHVAQGRDQANQLLGHVQIVDSSKDHPAGAQPDGKPEGANPEAAKPAAHEEGGVWGWMKHAVSTVESAGESALHNASTVLNNAETQGASLLHQGSNLVNRVETAGENALHQAGQGLQHVEQKVEKTVSSIAHSDTLHNVLDVGETLAAGVGQSAAKLGMGVVHGVEAVGHGIEQGVEWAEKNPVKAGLIAAAAVGVAAVEIGTGGLATPFIVAGAEATLGALSSTAAVTAFTYAGFGAAGLASANAVYDVAKHGEIGTLMNQQHESPDKVQAAHDALKKDTGDALLGDLMLGGGYAVKWAAKGISALRAGTEVAGAETSAASTAQTGEAATAARPPVPGETPAAVHPGETPVGAHPGETPPHVLETPTGDNAHLTPGENAAAHITEEAIDAGAASTSLASPGLASILERVREIAGDGFGHYNNANSGMGAVKGAWGFGSRVMGHGYAVAAPQSHDTDSRPNPRNQPGRADLPDEQTKH
jgi:hypothetical protein